MRVNSKSKGNIGESKSVSRLLELGNSVSLPFGDNERYDLVVESISGELLKAQVKYSSTVNRYGSLEFSLQSSTHHTNKKGSYDYDGEVDLFLLYHSVTDKVYVLTASQFSGKKSIQLRITPTKNNQVTRVNNAVDFELNKAI